MERPLKTWRLAAAVTLVATGLTAPLPFALCADQAAVRQEEDLLAKNGLHPGMTPDEVLAKLGEPSGKRSITAMEGTELQDWYYAKQVVLHFINGVLKAASAAE
ncbi:MAG TPA: hypothetical protein VFB20_11795 [Burkholderiales bacterium]|nr:hypothetical protein [Burkholderiales bacterium]